MAALPPESFQFFEGTMERSSYIGSMSAPAWNVFRTSVGGYLSDSFIQRARATRAWANMSGLDEIRDARLPLPLICGFLGRQCVGRT